MTMVRENGVVIGLQSEAGFHPRSDDNPVWMAWLAANPGVDISARAPDPVPVDEDAAPIDAFLARAPATMTPVEVREMVIRIVRRLRKGI